MNSLLVQAHTLLDLGRDSEALVVLGALLREEPDHCEALCLIALAYQGLGDLKAALVATDQAVAVGVNQEFPHRVRAHLLLVLGRKREARREAREAVRLAPDSTLALYSLAVMEGACRNRRAALRAARRCAALDPGSVISQYALANAAVGVHKWDEIENLSLNALKIDPENALARHNLGIAIARQRGRSVEGIEHLLEASKLDPRNGHSRVAATQFASKMLYGGSGLLGAATFLLINFAPSQRPGEREGLKLFWLLLIVFAVLLRILYTRKRAESLPSGLMYFVKQENLRFGRTGLVLLGAVFFMVGLIAWMALTL